MYYAAYRIDFYEQKISINTKYDKNDVIMVESSITNYVLVAAHVIVGSILIFFAIKAFKRTKYFPMALLVIGFTLLVLGETVIEYIFAFTGESVGKIIEEGFEIAGFIVLIIAVKKS